MDDGKHGSQEFADIVPGRTTEVYFEIVGTHPEDQRANERQPALVMLEGDQPGRVFRLPVGRQLIGRKDDCQIRLREEAVSEHHAEIVRSDAGVSVSDLSGSKGTVVNGRRIRSAVFLAQGNLLKLGTSVFRYVDSLIEVERTESLYVQSTLDPVTSLWNRQHLVRRLASMLDQATAAKPVSVVAFELERLSDRRSGLLTVAKILHDSFNDIGRYFGRIGDESFAAVLGGAPVTSAAVIAASLRKAIESAGLKASVGVAGTERPADGETLLAAAEQAMTRARREGGNRVVMG